MPTDSWDKAEIKKLAGISGKPLEVQCASEFLQAGWKVLLGTYYHDMASDKIRELDILIQRTEQIVVENFKCDVNIRVLGSCKGFRSDYSPITYSVHQDSRAVHRPIFMYRSRRNHGDICPSIASETAARFLHSAQLGLSRQVVGFDIYSREEVKNKNSTAFEYSRKTDRDLYEGLDSAIKAAVYWDMEDSSRYSNMRVLDQKHGHATLTIPLLVTSLPFWNVAIDEGKVGEPELCHSGYTVGLYPFAGEERHPKPVMSLLWAISKLSDLTKLLNVTFDVLLDEAKITLQKTIPKP